MKNPPDNINLFLGLKALAASAFPKSCSSCGRTFATADQFIEETKQVREDASGLKQTFDDDNLSIIELYRNCLCGSTLMDVFSDRRDLSKIGIWRRKQFGGLLSALLLKNFDRETARAELLKVLHGERSEALANIAGKSKNDS